MVLKSFDGAEPSVHESAWIAESAVIIGDVTIEAEASVWPNATLRGDEKQIVVGEAANVQDNAVCHNGARIKPRATIGHAATVHGATIDERAMVGIGAVVLDGSTIGSESLVASGSVVTENTDVPPRTLVAGIPAEVIEEVEDSPWTSAADHYVDLANKHEKTSETIQGKGGRE